MIFSFSVPETAKYQDLIGWYRNADKQERSRQFREIFLSYLNGAGHSIETRSNHISLPRLEEIKLDRMNLVEEEKIDLDAKLNLLGGG